MHIDRALVDIDIASPHPVEQLGAAEHAAGALHEELEQPELSWTEMHLAAVPRHPMRFPIELDIAHAEDRGDALGVGTPQDGPDPRHQLRQRERLDHIVVASGGEPPNAVALLA